MYLASFFFQHQQSSSDRMTVILPISCEVSPRLPQGSLHQDALRVLQDWAALTGHYVSDAQSWETWCLLSGPGTALPNKGH